MADPVSADEQPTVLLWAVGAVAQQLDVSVSTLRTWDRRYGLGPVRRTPGGHRRYSADDIDRVRRMRELVASGVSPGSAARSVRTR